MPKPKIYLETTIFNFVFAEDAPEKRQDTLQLFRQIQNDDFQAFTSYAVVNELAEAPEPKRSQMLNLIGEHGVAVIEDESDADRLADVYVAEGVIPLKYRDDAVHIPIASISDMALIVSWNFQHIVKMKTKNMVNVINVREGVKPIEIYSPMEVVEYDGV